MRILIVAATAVEVAPLVAKLRPTFERGPRKSTYAHAGHDIAVLTSGVGMVATAVWTSRILALTRYDLALNVGICGSFESRLSPGTVVHVVSDRIAELGAEDDQAFLSLEELNLPGDEVFANSAPPSNPTLDRLPTVAGITVNTIHGNDESIAAARERFHPQVESMEGAAFMHACLVAELAFAQVRAVSNVVERRNRGVWQLGEAVENLGRTALDILETL